MRQPIFYSDIAARLKYKEEGMRDLEARAREYAKKRAEEQGLSWDEMMAKAEELRNKDPAETIPKAMAPAGGEEAPLPAGWAVATDASGRSYFWHKKTQKGMAEGGRLPAAAGPAQDSGSDGGNPLPAQLGLSDFYRHYAPELLAALADSGVMEQQARLLIALAPVSLSLSSGNSGAWGSFEVTVGDWLLSVIRRLITGPCVQFCTLSLGLATLCAADGGRSYGAPAELLAALAQSCGGRSASDNSSTPGFVAVGVAALRVTQLRLMDASRCTISANRIPDATLVESLAAVADRRWWRQAALLLRHGLGGADTDLRDEVQMLLVQGIRDVHTALASEAAWPTAATEGGPAGNAHAADRSPSSATAAPARSEPLAQLQQGKAPVRVGLRAELCAGGLLPDLLEGAFRRCAREPRGADRHVANRLAAGLNTRVELFVWLLMTAPAREAASLVLTMGKLLRRANSDAYAPVGGMFAIYRLVVMTLEHCRLAALANCDTAASGTAPANLPQPSVCGGLGNTTEVASEPGVLVQTRRALASERMLALKALMVREWLPALFEHARRSTPVGARPDSPLQGLCCLGWLTTLVEHCVVGCSGGGAGSSGAAGGAAGSSSSNAEHGWDPELRRFVLHDLCAAAHLQSSLRAHNTMRLRGADASARVATAQLVAEACVAYAALAPEEWRSWEGAEGAEEPWVAYLVAVRADLTSSAGGPHTSGAQHSPHFRRLVDWAMGMRGGKEAQKRSQAAAWSGLLADMRAAVAGRRALWASALPRGQLVLLPLSEAGRALQLPRRCSNPACVELEGDCEAERPLKACGGCGGAAVYCCKGCQRAHWRAGHSQACDQQAPKGNGGG
eukprot:XP_001691082.1 predicted protein [Chlamydomonas reinhardtii]